MINREPILSLLDAWEMCLSVMMNVFSTARPAASYCDAGARLLMMIGAHESAGFKHPRQHDGLNYYPLDSGIGAYGLWQTEPISIVDSLQRLEVRQDIAHRASRWLFLADVDPWWYRAYQPGGYKGLYTLVAESPRASCLFARLHLLWDSKPIPSTIDEQAQYAKRVYNKNGAATCTKYAQAWYRYCEPFFAANT
jgi:hypothetical protein